MGWWRGPECRPALLLQAGPWGGSWGGSGQTPSGRFPACPSLSPPWGRTRPQAADNAAPVGCRPCCGCPGVAGSPRPRAPAPRPADGLVLTRRRLPPCDSSGSARTSPHWPLPSVAPAPRGPFRPARSHCPPRHTASARLWDPRLSPPHPRTHHPAPPQSGSGRSQSPYAPNSPSRPLESSSHTEQHSRAHVHTHTHPVKRDFWDLTQA